MIIIIYKKTKSSFIKYRKWLSVPIYSLIVLIIGVQRNSLVYSHLSNRWSSNIYDVLFALLAIATFIGVVYLCTSPFRKREFKQICESISLKNDKGKCARLVSVCNDSNKKHGKIYRVRNYHISMDDFDKKLTQKSAIKFCIYAMEYNRNATQTILYVLNRKYVKPTVISDNNSAIGQVDVKSMRNCLLVGATGSGKTVAIKILMSKIVKFQPDAQIWILDYKNADFRAFKNCPHYYSYTDCVQGLNDYYAAFKEQQNTGVVGAPNYLIMDEWASFILSLDKKQSELLKARLSELLMLGRSYVFVPIIGQQTAMSELYPAGARSNFKMILSMGNVSKEQKSMLFSEYKEQMTEKNKTGEGYLLIDGQPRLERVKFEVKDFNKLDKDIISALQC